MPDPTWSLLVNWDGSGWDDVSADVESLTWRRGSTGEFGSADVGSATVELRNTTDRYLDTNPASPLFGKLQSGGEALFTAVYDGITYPIFGGYVKTLDPRASYIPLERRAQLVCEDALGRWARRVRATIDAQLDGIGLRDARSAVLDAIALAANRRQLSPSNDPVIYGRLVEIHDADGNLLSTFEEGWSGTPTELLSALNAASLGRHFIRPGTTTAIPWRYATVDRNHKIDSAPDASLTHLTDYSDLRGWRTSDMTKVDYVTVRPRQPGTGEVVEAESGDPDGPVHVALSSDLIPRLSSAQGLADHYQWRFREERRRPALLLDRRLPLAFQRDLFDVIEVTDPRYYLEDRRMEIVGVSGSWSGVRPVVSWQLQEAPQQPPLVHYGVLDQDVLSAPYAQTAR